MNGDSGPTEDEAAVRSVIETWAAAVRRRDVDGILQNHASDMVMFDVPPRFQSVGLDAYRSTWDFFYAWTDNPIPFDIAEMKIVAGHDVAFRFATLHCAEPGDDGAHRALDFRLTMGLHKVDGRWTILHEHHSVPAAG